MPPAHHDPTRRPIADLVEEAVDALSSEVLYAMAARKASAELRGARETEPTASVDWDGCLKVDLNLTVRRLVELRSSFGIDTDIAAGHLLPRIIAAGISEVDALEALQRATGWRPRTDRQRVEAVVRGMLEDGFTPDEIKRALRHVEDERSVAA